MYLNKTYIIGNLTKDPELKALPSGSKVVNFSVATNRTWYNEAKEKQEAVEYHNVVAFGKQAETIAQYMKKGSQILVEGRLQTRSWETDGVKKYSTEIVLENFQFGKKAESQETRTEKEDRGVDTDEEATKKFADISEPDNYPEDDSIDPDSIPF